MANEFDLEQLINKVNEENDLDKKLSGFEEKETPVPAESAEDEKKKSKAEIAKMIAARLSDDDDDEIEEDMSSITQMKPKPMVEAKPAVAAKPKPKPVRIDYEEYEDDDEDEAYEKPSKKKKSKEKEKSGPSTVGIIVGFFVGLLVIALLSFYVGGMVMTSGKFLPGTTINGEDVSMMTSAQVTKMFEEKNTKNALYFTKTDGTSVEIPLSSIGYELHTSDKVQKLLDEKNPLLWFTSLIKPVAYKTDVDAATYDDSKLRREIGYIDWGNTEPVDAYIASSSEGFVVIEELDGFTVDLDKLFEHTKEILDDGEVDVKVSNACTILKAAVTKDMLQKDADRMNDLSNITITIDFDYAQEQLTGNDFGKWLTYKDDGSYTVDRDKVMGYVEELARKYDTYNKPRKFNATLQGEITVPISDDAKYGWWIYKDETADLLVKLIEEGKSVTTDPIYYYTKNADGTKGYTFTGVEEARTAEDDIGDTYVEIDLTAQTLWHYVDGKQVYKCGIVSGQLKPAVRKTLPGVYKVWFKARNHTMKSSNSAGESWEVKCSYWTRVAIVGIGLHDSQWRGNNVGGQIYKTNGSHGCINMTLAGAKYIYENVDYGTPVVMYY
ncbi:MAG: hypothetical protein E7509_06055 [Ruminococcus sp.]|nr:hypothetical protein [Ruminococcus sp.]